MSQDGRHAMLNGLYWLVVICIGIGGITHWLFGIPSDHAIKPFFWIFMAICALGLLNSLAGRR